MHISLDMWNTFCIPNLEFSKQRNEYIADEFNLEYDDVKAAYDYVKQHADQAATEAGLAWSVIHMYQVLLDRLKVAVIYSPDGYDKAEKLARNINIIYHALPPIVPQNTIETLKYAIQKRQISISIGSNTNFISGTEVHKFVNSLGIFPDFGLYSDIIGYSKPHGFFWSNLKFQAQAYHSFEITPDQILHIGDNEVCDGGASKSGLRTHIISHPIELATAISDYL
jgi:FMN phosphatase YigB (HAD superfamily)